MILLRMLGAVTLLAWIYLLLFRGRFWRFRDETVTLDAPPRRVAAVIPARDEADVIRRAIESLAAQEFEGELYAFIVDDHSSDGTAERARAAIQAAGAAERFTLLAGRPLPRGWTGKLWAVSQGIQAALAHEPDYLLLTDADIQHAPHNVRSLVARAEFGQFDLTSYMVRLHCGSLPEAALIPAFVFFFFKLYPPRWVADPARSVAAAAGGCILIRPDALERIGGVASIRGEIIDDCALAKAVKRAGGRIWMGLTFETVSLREYHRWSEIWNMIARTGFTELRHSALLLAGVVFGMAVLYLGPPVIALSGDRVAATLGVASWGVMTVMFLPAVRYYGRNPLWALALPLTALFFTAATIHSAIRYWRGRGGEWKGRMQARTERDSPSQRLIDS